MLVYYFLFITSCFLSSWLKRFSSFSVFILKLVNHCEGRAIVQETDNCLQENILYIYIYIYIYTGALKIQDTWVLITRDFQK